MLKLANVSAGYGGQDMIHDISLHFESGKVYSIVGKNGCGKSTLLKTCTGLLQNSSGSIQLNARTLKQYTPIERACLLSYLAQTHGMPAISVERLVEHGRYPRLSSPHRLNDSDRRIVETSMDRLKITHLRKKNLHEISGGERQRVYLAMLLAQDAPLILLDEPVTYMDVEHQLALLELMQELKHEGKCVVMVLHDLLHALRYSDTIIAMDNGRIVSCAAPETMLANKTLEHIFHVKIEMVGSPVKGYLLNKQNPANS